MIFIEYTFLLDILFADYYLASNAYLYDLVLGKPGPDGCLLLCKQCTDPDLRQFLHRLVGNTSQTQKSHFV